MFQRIYLDNSATTPVDPLVFEAMLPYLTEKFGNASSIHSYGQETRSAVDKARHQVASLINARPNEIVFTSGGTESDNLAIRGLIEGLGHKREKAETPHIITSAIEHPAVRASCEELEKRGASVTYVPVYEDGIVRIDDIRAAINENTVLISLMLANNEIGTLQPVAEIGRIVRSLRESGKKIWLHTDAVQAVGKIKVDVQELGCDLLSLSGHKIYAPKGIGALYVRRGVRLQPQNVGGRQERGVRGGTEPVHMIAGLGAAAELAAQRLAEDSERLRSMRNNFEDRVFEEIDGAVRNGNKEERVPNITNISFSGVEGEGLLINLDMQGIAISTGSACSSGSLEPSPIISALGRETDLARGAVRFSFGRINSASEIEKVVTTLSSAVENLRRLSPAFRKRAGS